MPQVEWKNVKFADNPALRSMRYIVQMNRVVDKTIRSVAVTRRSKIDYICNTKKIT